MIRMTRVCRQCAQGRHTRCVGIRCFCEETERCYSNAVISHRNTPEEVTADA